MASEETFNIQQSEPIINRWLVDYYLFLAIDLFEKKQYDDFCAIRDTFDYVLSRPLESTETTPTKIKVVQFLSCIKDAESLGEDSRCSPLESALQLLQTMKENCPLQVDYGKWSSSLKEMIVKIFIMKGEFDRAKKALKNFPKTMNGKKEAFMSLINQRVQNSIDQKELIKFREEMLCFCQNLCQITTPFLLKAAIRLNGSRHTDPDDDMNEHEPQDEPEQHSCKLRNRVFITKSRLEAGFKMLADASDFIRLEKEIEEEPSKTQSTEEIKDQLYLRNSDSPLEASPADEPAQMSDLTQAHTGLLSKIPSNGQHYTVARLVMEPDTPNGSPELDNELESREILEISKNLETTQSPLTECEVSKPLRKKKTCARSAIPNISDADDTNTSRVAENEDVMVSNGLDRSPDHTILKAGPQTSSTPHKVKSPCTTW
ncbi:hypothetical protein WMY93_013345 [Mugilogobius chulae]|uniref:Telomere repeat-binding factor dimerisation domain-containing protein n=1 Tax=Mugilogobius chulae TaxID=88201 RepID=A0AAW0PB58_9GOBI